MDKDVDEKRDKEEELYQLDIGDEDDIWEMVNIDNGEDWGYAVDIEDSSYEEDMIKQYKKKTGRIPYHPRKRVKVAICLYVLVLIISLVAGLYSLFSYLWFFVFFVVVMLFFNTFLFLFVALDKIRFERLFNPEYVKKDEVGGAVYMIIGIMIGFMCGRMLR